MHRGILLAVGAVGGCLLGSGSAAGSPAAQPSFSCDGALKPVEQIICTTPLLAEQDRLLADLFRQWRDGATTPDKREERVRGQRGWVKQRDQACQDSRQTDLKTKAACISDQYADRIGTLIQELGTTDVDALTDAIDLWQTDAAQAEATLRSQTTPTAKLDLLLALHAFKTSSPQRDEEIRRLQGEVDRLSNLASDDYVRSSFGAPVPFDGTDQSLIRTIMAASQTSVAQTGPAFYAIPCRILVTRPGLLDAIAPAFGSNRDNFQPRSGCSWGRGWIEGFPDSAVDTYTAFIDAATGNALLGEDSGTIRFMFQARLAQQVEVLKIAPSGFLSDPATEPKGRPFDVPYQTWAYLTIGNHELFRRIEPAYRTAYSAMIAFLDGQDNDLTAEQRREAVRRGLLALSLGGACGDEPPQTSLRTLLLDGQDLAAIQAFIDTGAWQESLRTAPFRTCARQGDEMDPLIHLAVTRPETLDILSKLAATVPEAEREALDLEMDPSAPNHFDKRPLMAAAHRNNLAAVDWLLARGVDVNHATLPETYLSLPKHEARTALMYAAANASLPVIERLLQAGADKEMEDSEGLRAVDYLVGNGPVPANPALSAQDRARAEKLLE